MTPHPTRWDAIIGGIAFALVCLGWFANQRGVLSLGGDLRLILPVFLIIAGLAGIMATLRATTGDKNE